MIKRINITTAAVIVLFLAVLFVACLKSNGNSIIGILVDCQKTLWQGINSKLAEKPVVCGDITYSVKKNELIATLNSGEVLVLYNIEKDKDLDGLEFSERLSHMWHDMAFSYMIECDYVYFAIGNYILRGKIGSNRLDLLVYIDDRYLEGYRTNEITITQHGDNLILFYVECVYRLGETRLHYYDINKKCGGFVALIGHSIEYTDEAVYFTTTARDEQGAAPVLRCIKRGDGGWGGVLGSPINANGKDPIAPFDSDIYEKIRISGAYLAIDENDGNVINFYVDCFDSAGGKNVQNQKVAYNILTGEWTFVE